MRRVQWGVLPVLALLAAATASAAPETAPKARWVETLGGHISIGYAKMTSDTLDAPGGSISLAAGVDYPVGPRLRAGVDLVYDLLGSRNHQSGSLFATVDYSALEVIGFLHWLPDRLGPVRRISVGPMMCNAHGDLSTAVGGASFEALAVHQTSGGVAVQATLLPAWTSPVKPGLELGWREAFLAGPDWTIFSVRLTVHD